MTKSDWSAAIPSELHAARDLLWADGQVCSHPTAEAEGAEYGAFSLTVDGAPIRFRIAKTTPTKLGQFVTVWQRSTQGPIRPFDVSDGVRAFVISVADNGNQGCFVFPLETLVQRDIVSCNGVGGKRGFRVYPPWVETANRQAQRSQAWQVEFYEGSGAAALPS